MLCILDGLMRGGIPSQNGVPRKKRLYVRAFLKSKIATPFNVSKQPARVSKKSCLSPDSPPTYVKDTTSFGKILAPTSGDAEWTGSNASGDTSL